MTQPNPGLAPAAPEPNQNPTPAAPATGPAPAPTTQPTPPGFVPAGAANTAAEDLAAQQLLAAAAVQQADTTTSAGPAAGQPDGLGDAGKRAIAEERKARKALEAKVAELSPAAELLTLIRKAAVPEADKTDLERLTERLEAQEKTASDERLARLRLEVIQDKGLTKAHAGWLKGSTYEELAASADALLALPPPAPKPAPQPADPPGDPAPAAQPNGQQPAGAAPAPVPTGPKPDPSQGARGPVDINAQIADALAKGDIRTSIALKQQLAAQQRGNQ